MGKVKDENHIVIHGWMINEFNLKGNELLIYAIIFGFSQNENQKYVGSLQYLADWTNSTKQGVMKNIKALIKKQLIVKENKVINGVNFVSYYTTKFHGVYNKVSWGIQQSLPNNIEYNIEDNTNERIKEGEIEMFDYDWLNGGEYE